MSRKHLDEEKTKSLVPTEKSKNQCATNSLDNSPYISELSGCGKDDSDFDIEIPDDTKKKHATETNDSDTDDDQNDSQNSWATVVEKLVALLQTKVLELKDQEWKEANGIYNENIISCLEFLDQLYFELPLRNAPLLFVKRSRKETARVILEADFIPKICMVLTDTYMEKLDICHDKTKKNLLSSYATRVLWNYTDASTDFAECVANIPGFLEFVKEMLSCTKYEQINNTEEKVSTTDELAEGLLAIVHNITMTDSCLPRLRALKFTEVLMVFLKSSNIEAQLSVLSSLAAIIDEAESEIIKSNESSIWILMERFRRSLQSEERRSSGWSCQECALTIKMLARNDANKKLLVKLGALELLVELAEGEIEEQKEAVGALWALSFDEAIEEQMVRNDKLGLIPCLEKLQSSEDKVIKETVNGILWNLRSLLQNSKDKGCQNIVKSVLASPTKKDNQIPDMSRETKKEGHIMISYQWSHQKMLLKIKDELVKNGFKVWMDVEQMMGSTVQAMAEAVENADIVLICLSHKYKNSENCRQEAEYSFKLKKKIVPLKLEEGYEPDGWLGFIAGANLYYEFSGYRPYDEELQRLVHVLTKMKQEFVSQQTPIHGDIPDGPISHGSVKPANKQIINTLKLWSQEDLNNWIKKNDLSLEKFGNLSADAIALLIRMKSEAPEAFYRYIEKLWTCDLDLLSKLVWALDDIEI